LNKIEKKWILFRSLADSKQKIDVYTLQIL